MIWCPPDEKHWHGATATTAMTHIAIVEHVGGKAVEWMEKVSDKQYQGSGRRMGHEAIGVVEAVGADVRTMKVGDVVVMPFAYSDGTCVFCHEGLHTSCIHGGFFGRSADRPHRSTEGGAPMTAWTSDELDKIAAAQELHIAFVRRDA